jgi:hypothetical protein
MKTILALEEATLFLLAILAFHFQSPFQWWWFPLCILLPDLSMLGYLAGDKVGAYVYNFAHHKAVAIAVYLLGFYQHSDVLLFIGIILFAHSSLDRVMGYGLKYTSGFKNTHLGEIGKK